MHRHSPLLTLAAAVLSTQVGMAQSATIRSADGRATMAFGREHAASPVEVAQLPDGDDVAGVAGAHYRVVASGTLPSGTTLTIRWDSAGLPGGVAGNSLALMRRLGDGWERLPGERSASGAVTAVIGAGGEFAVRWFPRHACSDAGYRTLDFRLGTADYRAPGYTPGRSVITRDPSGCALYDHYVDQQGARSTSFFLFDSTTGRWFNTTIDPGGRSISVGRVDGESIAFYHSPGDREVYRRRPDGTIAFAAERSSDNGQTWKAWATATYTPVR